MHDIGIAPLQLLFSVTSLFITPRSEYWNIPLLIFPVFFLILTNFSFHEVVSHLSVEILKCFRVQVFEVAGLLQVVPVWHLAAESELEADGERLLVLVQPLHRAHCGTGTQPLAALRIYKQI